MKNTMCICAHKCRKHRMCCVSKKHDINEYMTYMIYTFDAATFCTICSHRSNQTESHIKTCWYKTKPWYKHILQTYFHNIRQPLWTLIIISWDYTKNSRYSDSGDLAYVCTTHWPTPRNLKPQHPQGSAAPKEHSKTGTKWPSPSRTIFQGANSRTSWPTFRSTARLILGLKNTKRLRRSGRGLLHRHLTMLHSTLRSKIDTWSVSPLRRPVSKLACCSFSIWITRWSWAESPKPETGRSCPEGTCNQPDPQS